MNLYHLPTEEKRFMAPSSGSWYDTWAEHPVSSYLTCIQILAWIAVIFRLWVRVKVVREPGWDDVFIAISAVGVAVTASRTPD